MREVICIEDFVQIAKKKLPSMLFDYIDGGSFSEVTKRSNTDDWISIRLQQNVMRDVSVIDTSVELLGERYSFPLGFSPVGFAGMFAKRGEVQAAMAARQENIPFCLSALSVCSIDEVVQKTSSRPWFQLYMLRDRKLVEALLDRVRAAGVEVLVLSVDVPVTSVRYRDYRSGLGRHISLRANVRRSLDIARRYHWLLDVVVKGRPFGFGNFKGSLYGVDGTDAAAWVERNLDSSMTWNDIEWIKHRWKGKFLIKGVLNRSDADQAVKSGADAVIVSNHGGRQLDGVPSTAKALPGIADRLGGSTPILVDGGIRSGLDIVRALSLGATACMVGRPWAFALASDGYDGVLKAIKILKFEMSVAMSLCGFSTVSKIAECFGNGAMRSTEV